MKDLNDEIENEKNSGLNRNYQIGPAYFLNLKNCIDPVVVLLANVYELQTELQK